MENYSVAIIGGGASGLMLAAMLKNENVILFERGERLGKKLSATGNGQGNITNLAAAETPYFSFAKDGDKRVKAMLARFGALDMLAFFEDLGGLFLPDERGRVYPTGRQASAVTDLLRFAIADGKTDVRLSTFVTGIRKEQGIFVVKAVTPEGERTFKAEHVVLCTGGKAAKNFGTDGNGYELAKTFSHTVTPLYPSLVQLKTGTKDIKGLKGLRVNGAGVSALVDGSEVARVRGDIIFTEYGVSGDAAFRLSAFIADKIGQSKVELSIDLLPDVAAERLERAIEVKKQDSERLCGIVNNQIGRAVLKRVGEGNAAAIAACVKAFTLPVTGTLGFDYAQVTKGGVRFDEVDEDLQSQKTDGLYLTGEVLDVDGECGGYNLQWAFTSAAVVAAAIEKRRGQV